MAFLEKINDILPKELRQCLQNIPLEDAKMVQEIRLRRGQPITFTGRGRSFYLSLENCLTTDPFATRLCKTEWIDQIFDNACDHSVYAHQEELRRGYVTTRSGCRIGVGGTAVSKDGNVSSFRSITSLCLRVAREHRGCAENLLPVIRQGGGVHSVLIGGEPSGGKTSFLKDLLFSLAREGIHAAVIDERGELSESAIAAGCDVLSNIPKVQGIEQAVRCLAPPLLILDELGDDAEIEAVTKGLYRGVPTIATIHCRQLEQLPHRYVLNEALRNGLFEFLVLLKGKRHPGEIEYCLKTEDWFRERDRQHLDRVDRRTMRNDGMVAVATTREGIATTER